MKLSIVTITYNAEKVLENTLKSIFSQTNQNFEYIIIDGNSTDGTLVLVDKFGVKNIVSEPDNGIYDAMNKGLAMATGEYIWFMNAGDELFDNDVVERLVESFNEKADIYYSETAIINEAGQILGKRSEITPHKLTKNIQWQNFKYGMLICHQSFIVRKSIAPKFVLNHYYSADIDWEIKCLKASKKTIYLEFILSKYLVGGFSVKNLKASLMDRFIVLKNHFGLPQTIVNHFIILFRGFIFASKKRGKYW